MPEYRLAHGDCLQLLRAVPSESVQLVLCDLPYGVTECAWDKKIAPAPLWAEYLRITPPNGAILLFAQQPFATELASAAPAKLFRYEWIWDKAATTGFGNARRMPLRRHENILVFYRRQPHYSPMGLRPCRPRSASRRHASVYGADLAGREYVTSYTGYPQSILRFPRDKQSRACQKPVALLEYLIGTYTAPGATVLDNAMGTGSAGVAAIRAGRNFVGIELDAERFAHAAARIKTEARIHVGVKSTPFWRHRHA